MALIKVKRSAVPGKVPLTSDLALGEFAVNTYDGIAFIKKSVGGVESIVPLGGASDATELQKRYSYIATSNQTVFAAQYTSPYVDVYQNGVKLGQADYTATNGSSITLATGAIANDLIEIVGHLAFGIADALPLEGGTMQGDIVFSGTQTFPWSSITGEPTTLAGYGITDAQATLVSGTNIKTINSNSLLGSGDIEIDVGVTTFNTRTGAVTLTSGDVTTALGYTPYDSTNPSGYTTNTGTVTSISTGDGITGGTITTSGTLSLTGQALALHNISTNGILVRTGTGTFGSRSLASGSGISVTNADGIIDAPITVSHADTSSQLSVDNSNGTVIQDITLDDFGHITSIGSVSLDDRYYTETEADTRFVNVSGDTMSGFLTLHSNPTSSLHAATKQYVDEVAEGLKAKPAVEVATTSNLSATYNNGTSGVGATLTATVNGAFPAIDGVTLTSTTPGENGVLVKNQTAGLQNGRYNLTQVGDAGTPWILTRCGLCDEADEIPGAYTFIKSGTLYGGTGWVQTVLNTSTFVVGTDSIIVTQFSGAGTYTAGTGLTLSGTQFSHTDTSSIANIDNSGNTFIQDLIFDTFGHVTGATSATVNIPATNIAEGTRTTTTVPITSSTGTGATLSAATTSLAGVMTASDKSKLDGIASGATANTGTVTSITTGTGLSGGTITTSGTISLANTTVTAGSYTNTNITVDAQGRITAASNGSAGGVSSFNTRTGAVTLTSGDVTTALGYTPLSTAGGTLTGDLSFGSQTGTWITSSAMSDSIGWNSSYGTYIGSTVGGTKYLYANGTFYDSTAYRTLWHNGNLTNLNQLTNGPGYITGESDTLATVTGRGASTSTLSTFSGGISLGTSSTRDKLRLWSDSQYTIGMQAGVTFGGLDDYAMTFQFNDESDRGFWWGDAGHSTAQGAMALTTNGWLTVARGIRVGGGESDISTPTLPFEVVGTNGQLFSVTDSMSGTIYSVNDISGIPSIEVLDTGLVKLAQYNGRVLIGTGTDDGTTKVQILGDISATNLNTTSDIRFKDNIVKIDNALEKVLNINGYTFTMKETGERSTGVIAQEVEKILPEVIHGSEDKKTVAYGNMVGLLIEAIKEQQKEIEALKQMIMEK